MSVGDEEEGVSNNFQTSYCVAISMALVIPVNVEFTGGQAFGIFTQRNPYFR